MWKICNRAKSQLGASLPALTNPGPMPRQRGGADSAIRCHGYKLVLFFSLSLPPPPPPLPQNCIICSQNHVSYIQKNRTRGILYNQQRILQDQFPVSNIAHRLWSERPSFAFWKARKRGCNTGHNQSDCIQNFGLPFRNGS